MRKRVIAAVALVSFAGAVIVAMMLIERQLKRKGAAVAGDPIH